jgi:hypothetical protein
MRATRSKRAPERVVLPYTVVGTVPSLLPGRPRYGRPAYMKRRRLGSPVRIPSDRSTEMACCFVGRSPTSGTLQPCHQQDLTPCVAKSWLASGYAGKEWQQPIESWRFLSTTCNGIFATGDAPIYTAATHFFSDDIARGSRRGNQPQPTGSPAALGLND